MLSMAATRGHWPNVEQSPKETNTSPTQTSILRLGAEVLRRGRLVGTKDGALGLEAWHRYCFIDKHSDSAFPCRAFLYVRVREDDQTGRFLELHKDDAMRLTFSSPMRAEVRPTGARSCFNQNDMYLSLRRRGGRKMLARRGRRPAE